jgi:uncharacterized protein
MIASLKLAQTSKKDLDYLDLNDLVVQASKIIAAHSPITTFAARHPWMGLEQQTFEQVARRLKDTCDVEIYPNDSVFQPAWKKGEIDLNFLEIELRRWLDSQSLELPSEAAERFCRTALMADKPASKKPLTASGLKRLAKKMSHFKDQIIENHAVQTYSQRLEQMGVDRVGGEINRHLIKWCKLFLDESQAVWSMPNREEGFYPAWRKLAPCDPALNRKVRNQIHDLPEEAVFALREALLALAIPHSEIKGYLEAHLLAMPGWAGAMLWRSEQSIQAHSLLMEFLAVRISMEWILLKPFLPLTKTNIEDIVFFESLITSWSDWGGFPVDAWSQLSTSELKARLKLAYRFDKIVRNRIWLEAWEKTYEDQLKKLITTKQNAATENKPTPAIAQFVFCIDVRSEPIRRKLEDAGPFETLGTAGFFGLPIATCELGTQYFHNSLPIMNKPQFKIVETSSEFEFKSYQQRREAIHSLGFMFKKMKHNLPTGLILPEISGPWLGLQTLARTFMPRYLGLSFRKIRQNWMRKPLTKLSLDRVHLSETELPVGFSDEEKVHYVRQSLKMMGLTDRFAPLVVICGHASHSTNNPYAAALDCGACGGTSGGFNARVLATLCNLPKVRQALETEGISIPKNTVFAAAEHVTTLDELRWLYVPELSTEAGKAFNLAQVTLTRVSEEANAERIAQLPNIGTHHKNPKIEAQRFAEDWSEVRPEWGLARNAAFIIGKRELTQDCNLSGRVFLHNYDWEKDKNGVLLANIITGPATVTQWINLQYYASTVAPHYYGSGNKATQTLTAGIGVMQGNASDLLTGLPWQSVMLSDQEVYHAPLRLLVVIQAPKKHVERLLDHDSTFHQKVQNGWIRLASIDSEGIWESWS